MSIENIINDAWINKDQINPSSEKKIKDTIDKIIYNFINCIFNFFFRARINLIFIYPSIVYNIFNRHNLFTF